MVVGYINVVTTWGSTGSPGVNTWAYRTTGSDWAGQTENAGLAGIVQDFYEAIQDTAFPDGVTISFDGLYHGLGTDEGDTLAGSGWSLEGGGGNPAPRALCIVANLLGATGGRRGRGKKFLGPLASQVFDGDGNLSPLWAGGVAGELSNLVDASDSFANGALGVYSRLDNLFRDAVSSNVATNYGVLRSRRD